MKFQDKIQLIRKNKGLSQEELAEIVGVSRQAIAKWEAGQTYPDIDNLIVLSDYFKVSIDSLLKTEEDDCSSFQRNAITTKTKDMVSFLCRAKRNTYAAHGAEVNPSRPNSHDLAFTEGNYAYYDTYLGGERFSGEEAIWKQMQPVWAMNYSGRILGEGFNGDFLKEVLYLVPEEYPFRGPFVHQNGDYSYHCIVNGDVDWFQGYEEIFLQNRKVYECYFHGGSVR